MEHNHQQNGLATIMAIGTAVPPFIVYQNDFPEYYCRLSGHDGVAELKNKLARVCEKTMIKKRHMHLTEDILRENPEILTFGIPSLNIRRKVIASEVPKVAAEAASKAIDEWGQPRSKITHLVFSTVVSVSNPGEDFKMMHLLELNPTTKRVSLFQQGCYAGATALRVAKDIAENNIGSRVLVVCADNVISGLQGPSDNENILVGMAFFGDGASAAIVGAHPIPSVERPIFQIGSTSVHIIPESTDGVDLVFNESGLVITVSKEVPSLIANNLEKILIELFHPVGVKDWNSLFWVTHPGGRKILDMIEKKLGLKNDKQRASRAVLSEYGNMVGACLLFIMDEIRRSSVETGMVTTGEGLDWGIVLGFGPGLTVEAVVLRAVPNTTASASSP